MSALSGAYAQSPAPGNIFAEGREDFVFTVQDSHIGYATGEALEDFTERAGLGTVVAETIIEGRPLLRARDGRPVSMIAEWGYSCIRLGGDEVDGAGLPRAGLPCFSSRQGCDNPATKEDAYARLKAYYDARRDMQQFPGSWLVSMTGHYYFQHYGAEFGADVLMSEVGENINSVQAHIAFTRGAARQYGKPWGIDMSAWYGPSINDYWAEADRVWCERRDEAGNCVSWHSGPENGHSLSLFRRVYYASYMAGAHWIEAEAGSINFLASKHPPAALSPLGEVAREFHQFTQAHPERGEPYVPVAILLDYYHGLGLSAWYSEAGKETTWDFVPMTEGDRQTLKLLDAYWPGSFRVMGGDESQYMVASPHGDTADVLLENAPLEAMLRYETLIFSGDLHWDAEKTERVRKCLDAGQTVVFSDFPSHREALEALQVEATESLGAYAREAKVGEGRVILLQDAGQWSTLLQELRQNAALNVEGEVEYLLNRQDEGWVVTLINNLGVTKAFRSPAVVDPEEAVTARVRWRSGEYAVETWRGEEAKIVEGGVEVIVPPGEVVVVALREKG